MKTIQLTQGKVALVDDPDYPDLSRSRWFAMRLGNHWVAGRNRQKFNGERGTILMHRQIMGFPWGEIDHKDRDGLNNQRSNLRLANRSQQNANSVKRPGKSGFRGVKLVHSSKFEARINVSGVYRYLGYFSSPVEAAKAYDRAAVENHGEFAVLNFPRQ